MQRDGHPINEYKNYAKPYVSEYFEQNQNGSRDDDPSGLGLGLRGRPPQFDIDPDTVYSPDGTTKAHKATGTWTRNKDTYLYGGSNDVWSQPNSTTWTPDLLNETGFTVSIDR